MSTVASPISEPGPIYRLSVEQYHAMINAEVLTEDDPVELVEGVLTFKARKSPRHRIASAKLSRAIQALLPGDMSVQWQDPITLEDSEPEPDLAVVRGQGEDYLDRHPGPADVLLVVEISDKSLKRDRGLKLRTYARAGINQYWIVNLIDNVIEVYTQPDASAAEPTYGEKNVFKSGDVITMSMDGRTLGTLQVADLLP